MLNVTSDTPSIRSIAIIGSGLAGLTAGILLGRKGHNVRVFEKSRGPGGRMSSKRVSGSSSDIGAQYFTARHPEFLAFLRAFAGADNFGPWQGRFGFQGEDKQWQAFPEETRYVGVPRMTAITRALSEHVPVTAQVRIAKLERVGEQWRLICTEGNDHGSYDQVIITAPPAQARDLLEASGLNELAGGLGHSEDSILACWAVAAHFKETPSNEFDAMRPDSDVLYWVANNSSKPERNDQGQWWVLHATPEWTQAHVEEPAEKVSEKLLAAFYELTGYQGAATDAVAHRWLYARSVQQEQPGYLLEPALGVGLAGDWLNGGRVEGAWESATRLVEALG